MENVTSCCCISGRSYSATVLLLLIFVSDVPVCVFSTGISFPRLKCDHLSLSLIFLRFSSAIQLYLFAMAIGFDEWYHLGE